MEIREYVEVNRTVTAPDGVEPVEAYSGGFKIQPERVTVTFSVHEDGGISTGSVHVHGHRVLKNGTVSDKLEHTVYMSRMERPQWIQDAIAESSPVTRVLGIHPA